MDQRLKHDVDKAWDEVLDYEYTMVEELCKSIGNSCRLVEVGCGAHGFLGKKGNRLRALFPNSIGIDIDADALSQNNQSNYRICGSCYSLPLQDNTVDILLCRWLFEHLEDPENALDEFARVLKKGGFLVVKTPNLLNYVVMISRITPTSFHNMIRSLLDSYDNLPTYYRANTRRALKTLSEKHGFAVRRLEHYSYSYMYFAFNRAVFLLMRAISRMVGRVTSVMQSTLFGVFEKVRT